MEPTYTDADVLLAFCLGAWLMYGVFLVMEEVVRRIGQWPW